MILLKICIITWFNYGRCVIMVSGVIKKSFKISCVSLWRTKKICTFCVRKYCRIFHFSLAEFFTAYNLRLFTTKIKTSSFAYTWSFIKTNSTCSVISINNLKYPVDCIIIFMQLFKMVRRPIWNLYQRIRCCNVTIKQIISHCCFQE